MDYLIMGCPQGITDKKYDRNTLIFNFGFVFDKNCDTAPFESVVRKLGATFTIYEVDLWLCPVLYMYMSCLCCISWRMAFFRTLPGVTGYQKS